MNKAYDLKMAQIKAEAKVESMVPPTNILEFCHQQGIKRNANIKEIMPCLTMQEAFNIYRAGVVKSYIFPDTSNINPDSDASPR